jgi:membrane protein YdbS with pleckstrin-like domain
MLSAKDKDFINYWEKVRDSRNNFTVKLTSGLPMAALFCVPILIFFAVIYIFFPEWYTKISNTVMGSTAIIIVIAVIVCMFFFSYFRMQYKWEMNEQLYRELKQKASKSNEQ